MVNRPQTIGAALRARPSSTTDRNIAGLLIRLKAIAARAIRLRMVTRAIIDRRFAGRRGRPQTIAVRRINGAIGGVRLEMSRVGPLKILGQPIGGAIAVLIARMFAGNRKNGIRRIAE